MAQLQEITDVDIRKRIEVFIKKNFLMGDSTKILNDDDSFLEKGIIDSTGVLELVSFIEESFNIKVEDEELIPANLDSINRLNIYIKSKINNS